MSGKYCKWRISFIAEKYKSDIQTIRLTNQTFRLWFLCGLQSAIFTKYIYITIVISDG